MASIFSIILSIPLAIMLDYVMEITSGWFIPSSVLGEFRIFGQVTIEQLVWLFFYSYLVVMFYEVFLHKACTHKLHYPKMKYLLAGLIIVFSAFVIIHLTNHRLLEIDYFYLKFGIMLGIIPVLFAIWKFPDIYREFFLIGS